MRPAISRATVDAVDAIRPKMLPAGAGQPSKGGAHLIQPASAAECSYCRWPIANHDEGCPWAKGSDEPGDYAAYSDEQANDIAREDEACTR
jgi:hypothetical protein